MFQAKKMGNVYEELDEAKAEIHRLREEYQRKLELSENLKRAHSEQLIKLQEASSQLDKQTQELNEKADEICTVKQMCEELKCNLKEKEGVIKHLISANEKLHGDCDEKLRKWEEEKREMIVALDEANNKNIGQEKQICTFKGQIEDLREFVSVSQRKNSEAQRKSNASKEWRKRDDVMNKLEEENSKIEDELKWKREQFKHLEEAHEKLRDRFQTSEKEREKEKFTMLDEICTLQTNLDSQTRISEGLQSRLLMCNQALAHEESRRKYLEVQLSECKTSFGNVSAECEDVKSKLECLIGQRDKEIASLRDLLGTKETVYKEMQYQVRKLELENQELMLSLKELQEARILEAGTSSSLSKLRNKLKCLEQTHRDCSTNLRAREAEWKSQMEQLIGELNCCRSELESRDTIVQNLRTEVEGCESLISQLMLQNEEASILQLVSKSEFVQAQLKLANEKADLELDIRKKEENASHLWQQLEIEKLAHKNLQLGIEGERQKVATLLRKAESMKFVEKLQLPLQNELQRHKELLKESSACQLQLKEQVQRVKSNLKNVSDALDKANDELAGKFCEGNQIEFELQIWKSIAERLKAKLEENYLMRREVEASLLSQIDFEFTLKEEKENCHRLLEEKDKLIGDLQQQLAALIQELNTRETKTSSLPVTCKLEGDQLFQCFKGKDRTSQNVQKEMEWFEQEWLGQELEEAIFAQVDAQRIHECEKESLYQLVQVKDHRIGNLQQLLRSLEQEFETSTASFSSQLVKMQSDVNLLHMAWENIKTAEVMKEIEIEEKIMVIVDLENDLNNLQQKVEFLEKSLSSSMEKREKIEAVLEAKNLEVNQQKKQFQTELRSLEALIRNLNIEKEKLLQDVVRLSSERESLYSVKGELCERTSKIASEDRQLMETLGKIVQSFNNGMKLDGTVGDEELFDPVKENMNYPSPSPTTKRVEAILNYRSPLGALNH